MTITELLDMKVEDLVIHVINSYLNEDTPPAMMAGVNDSNLPWCIVVATTRDGVDAIVRAIQESKLIDPVVVNGPGPDSVTGGRKPGMDC